MTKPLKPCDSSLLVPPLTSSEANKIFWGVFIAGMAFVPMVFVVFHYAFSPYVSITRQEFFFLFTAVYGVLFVVCSNKGKSLGQALRSSIQRELPVDATVLAPTAMASMDPLVVALGRKYWYWQLAGSYLSGMTFSWLACGFYFFFN